MKNIFLDEQKKIKIFFDGTEDASLPGQYSETIHLVLVSHKCKAHSRLHSQRIESLMLT